MIETRLEGEADFAAIHAVHEAAFGQDAEARLVDRLRIDGLIVASIVGILDEEVVASAVLSEVTLTTRSGPMRAVALAPVAVMPGYHRRGLGTAVVAHGLRICTERGYEAAFVRGDPAYYARFGFSPELARAVSSPYSDGAITWQALQLYPPSHAWEEALAVYPAAFSIVM
ncbi:MAG TPA: N-acetyltransferase [Candidatus Aquilonibacter sp.]